jgi:hypothetical protein
MKRATGLALLFLAVPMYGWGQAEKTSKLVSGAEAPSGVSQNTYTVIGATAAQETFLRSQIQIMRPEVLPLRIVFVTHWKYLDTARTFRLHVPTGYASTMFTHLPSRTVFIDADLYINNDSLAYWMAHELGHLATNSAKESDAEKAAGPYRARLKESAKPDSLAAKSRPTLERNILHRLLRNKYELGRKQSRCIGVRESVASACR